MKIIVDECIAKSTKKILKGNNFELLEIEDILGTSSTDEDIYNYAVSHSIPIITHDRGFGEIYHKMKKQSPMIVILQKLSPHPETANNLLVKRLEKIDIVDKKYQGKLIIITSSAIRIRP